MNNINTPTGVSTVNDINTARASAVQAGTNPYSGAGATALSNAAGLGNKPINASSLGQTPIQVPPTTPTPTPYAGAVAQGQASQDSAEKQAEADIKSANDASGLTNTQNQQAGMMDSIKSLLGMESDAQTASANANQPALDKQNSDLADINTQIADTNVKLRGELDAIKGRGDITQSAQQGLADNANATYGRTLADLAIRQSAANGNITALEANAKYALDQKLAPIQTELSYYKDFLSANLDSLSKSEQTQANAIIADKQNIINQSTKANDTMVSALKTATENGVKVPDSVVKAIQADPANAYSILASNGISLANPADQALKYANAQAKTPVANPDGTQNYSTIDITRYGRAANNIVKNFIALPQYSLVANAFPYLQRIQAADTNPGSVSDADLLDSLVKVNTGGGQVTEAQVKLITDGKSYADTVNVLTNKLENGGVLSDSQRTQLTDLATAVFDKYKTGFQPVYDQVTSQLKAAGIPQAFWTIPDLNTLDNQDTSAQSGGSDLKSRASQGGYDYAAMQADGYSDTDIEAALKAQGL